MIEDERELVAMLKGAFSDFAIEQINVSGDNGTYIAIPAVLMSDEWAVHPTISGFGWTCTHRITGFAAKDYPSLAQALMSLGVLITSPIPWNLIANGDDFKRILGSLPAERKALRKALEAIAHLDIPVGSI